MNQRVKVSDVLCYISSGLQLEHVQFGAQRGHTRSLPSPVGGFHRESEREREGGVRICEIDSGAGLWCCC